MCCHALLQGIFPSQGSSPHLLHLLHCRWILLPLSHWGSPQWRLHSNKTEWSTCYNTGEPWEHYAKLKTPNIKGCILHDSFTWNVQNRQIHVVIKMGFPGGSDSKESTCKARDPASIFGLGRSPGERNGYPLQYSSLENSMDGGAWQATVRGVSKNQTGLSE